MDKINAKISKLWFYLHSLNTALDNAREANSVQSRSDERSAALLDKADALLKQVENELKGLENDK